ncbi:MAG: hypothetical protein PHS46_01100 [Candidatus Omnitrophica bacterium]|nr:hypothetical protein [Candidatus Omnitrophota bacterium]
MAEDTIAVKWYYRPIWVIVALLAAGPFALPLVWLSPALKKLHKIFLTIAVLIITVWLIMTTAEICRVVIKQMEDIKSIMQT